MVSDTCPRQAVGLPPFLSRGETGLSDTISREPYGSHIMKWEGREQSKNVEDRRGMGGRAGMVIGGGGLLILLIATLLGFDPRQVAQLIGGGNPAGGGGQ